jgi:16S rRNA (guanine966-N2)-methyltransferase
MCSLRVIAGEAKGRKLRPVPGNSTRPITDRTKESLFNILGSDVVHSRMLDLFAGTGSVGIEALSRGADFVRFVDNNQLAIKTIKYNLTNTNLENRAEVLKRDAFGYLKSQPDVEFDYIYIAPPQYKGFWKRALARVESNQGWLSGDAWVIVQIHPVEYEALALSALAELEQRRYGSTLLIFFERL